MCFSFALPRCAAYGQDDVLRPLPTYGNVSYGSYPRNDLDFWSATSERFSPLVIFIHGGGFISGSKEKINPITLNQLLKAGISVASVNYRYSTQAPLPAAHMDVVHAVQFLRSKANEWKFDKSRIGAFGISAGAQLAMYLAFHPDMSMRNSGDMVRLESTRLSCVASIKGQVSINSGWMLNHIPGFQVRIQHMIQLFDVKTLAEANQKADRIAALNLITSDDPPVYMSYEMAPGQPSPTEPLQLDNWILHHVAHGIALKKACSRLNVECDLHYPGAKKKYSGIIDFFVKHLL